MGRGVRRVALRQGRRRRVPQLPLDEAQYRAFVAALLAAEKVAPHAFEEPRYFEGCLPIEVMAERGPDTLAFGPMKPVGLSDPRTGRGRTRWCSCAARTASGTAYNLVGFQTRMTWAEQRRVFALIPGLEQARVRALRQRAPQHVHELARGARPRRSRCARCRACTSRGRSPASRATSRAPRAGLCVGCMLAERLHGRPSPPPPETTALGALLRATCASRSPTFSLRTWCSACSRRSPCRRAAQRPQGAPRGAGAARARRPARAGPARPPHCARRSLRRRRPCRSPRARDARGPGPANDDNRWSEGPPLPRWALWLMLPGIVAPVLVLGFILWSGAAHDEKRCPYHRSAAFARRPTLRSSSTGAAACATSRSAATRVLRGEKPQLLGERRFDARLRARQVPLGGRHHRGRARSRSRSTTRATPTCCCARARPKSTKRASRTARFLQGPTSGARARAEPRGRVTEAPQLSDRLALQIDRYLEELGGVRRAASNTAATYGRDLRALHRFAVEHGFPLDARSVDCAAAAPLSRQLRRQQQPVHDRAQDRCAARVLPPPAPQRRDRRQSGAEPAPAEGEACAAQAARRSSTRAGWSRCRTAAAPTSRCACATARCSSCCTAPACA